MKNSESSIMRESWRWFGPGDPVSLKDIRQIGVTDIVTALHDIPIGEVWPIAAIRRHQALIENNDPDEPQLKWSVVESIPVHDAIKTWQPNSGIYLKNWIATMENLAECGIKTICYNFMPVIDWTRTDLMFPLKNGAYTLRFDQKKLAVFDLFILKREAEKDYSDQEVKEAWQLYRKMSLREKSQLTDNIIAGLPGKMTESYSLDDFRQRINAYKNITRDQLRENLFKFLDQVLPTAERLGVKLAIHPDDPPRDLLGLPRVICTAEDLDLLFARNPSPANGITLCVGTYGSRPDNDLPEMARKFASRIHFAHLRGVTLDDDERRSFSEAGHLDSDVAMVKVVEELLTEEKAREARGETENTIFFRPDHGHLMLDDINKATNPGYSCIGRLKGLSEIRGIVHTLSSHY